ncbi:unnamed protein product [Oikopleura dioica]|uniref:K Homology domain-containing protein n=1 Tax=Oikopleura dioica TaxID=34765 RepID=E4XD27_OIKDI|nr:unnamed protein product [Oikopleura dioica]
MPAGFDENDKKTRDKCLYLKQLLADKRTMAQMPGAFTHLDRLLDDEILKKKKSKKKINSYSNSNSNMQGPLMGAATVAAPFKPAEIKMERPNVQNGQMHNSSTRSSSPLERVAANGSPQDKDRATYLQQLIKDQKTCLNYPNVFHHVERLLADEIVKVRSVLFQNNTKPLELPTPTGKTVTLSKKVFVPAKDYPDYNFVGRILGPRGLTAKQLEQETGCKIMVRGKGSMRDKKKEEQNKGRPNWEHLNEELHVLITVEDSENRADVKLQRATQEIEKLLVPQSEGEDDLKKKQLMELAIINGTYRDNSNGKMAAANGMSRLSMPGLLQSTNPAFRMPNLMSQMMTPGLMNTSMLRPPISINSSMQNMEQPTLYYAPMVTG